MIRKLLLSSIATTTLITIPAVAQNDQQSIEEIQITSNSRRSQGLADINAAVSVLGQAELDLIGLTHYQEALNRLPGYSGHRNNGQESLNAIRSPILTGAGACGDAAAVTAACAASFDPVDGGFGQAPKFPPHGMIAVLLAHHHRTGEAHALEMATFTLDAMAKGGMYDQLAGGFARYSVDDEW
jgi:hypothetical protein